MGPTLLVAGERRAYALSDIGTFLRFRERTGLAALSRPDPSLRNVYSVLRVSPERFPGRIRAEEARAFEAFLVDPGIQERIAEFGKAEFGEPLFRPLALPAAAGASGD
jgi:tungstate transport system substrate-binding protein